MIEIDMPIHYIMSEYDGITFVGKDGEKMKISLNKDEFEMLKTAVDEQV